MALGCGRVLVVDDEDVIRAVLIEGLGDEGYEVRAAADGREALTVLGTWRPDVIILDLMMPVMDGATFRAEQGKLDGLADIPVILLSATRDLRAHAKMLGAAAAFLKPFDVGELLTAIRRVTGRRAPDPPS